MKSLYYAAGAAWAYATKQFPVGRNIYDAEWDICIVLDSARVDALRERWPAGLDVAHFGSEWSRGSISTEWYSQTFRPEHRDAIGKTTLVTANPHSKTTLEDGEMLTNAADIDIPFPESPAVGYESFRDVHELWRTHALAYNVVPPDVMADATIQAYREDGRRVVAHWMQPHEPFIAPDAPLIGGKPTSRNCWDAAMAGSIDENALVESYERNLDFALFEVLTVLRNVDARVLITADHGNAFGEWFVWGHPFGWPQPEVRKVPWVLVDAENTNEYEPDDVFGATSTETDVTDQLAALGYR